MKHDKKSTATTGLSPDMYIPHQGSLCRVVENDEMDPTFVIEISLHEDDGFSEKDTHELVFNRNDFEFATRVFAILDTESTSLVHRDTIQEFVSRRCPVFWRRDEDLIKLGLDNRYNRNSTSRSPTFVEMWDSVVSCGVNQRESKNCCHLGLDGWIVFFRFIALAQYLEAKRRFSARHLQQTMRHRNAPRGSEVVVVDVPPPEPPAPLTAMQLATYERNSKSALPAPELDLDHILLAAHDCNHDIRGEEDSRRGHVKIALFGSSPTKDLEFKLAYSPRQGHGTSRSDEVVVRRSMSDMKWLDQTFSSHKVLGGTLCGRILPPFPGSSGSASQVLSSHFQSRSSESSSSSMLPSSLSIKHTTGSAINVAAAGVGRIRDAAKTFMGSYLAPGSIPEESSVQQSSSASSAAPSKPSPSKSRKHAYSKAKKCISLSLPENYYNPNLPVGKARQLERYLNYLLEHPALSKSFPLNTILTASQSGVEAAKDCIKECSKSSKAMHERSLHLDDGKFGIPLFSHNSPNFAWVRTAAQAAVALKVHGMLETSGLPSASARLQHASLPSFGHPRGNSWEEMEMEPAARSTLVNVAGDNDGVSCNFEDGVVNDDGFDLLPLPVPAPERRILNAGSCREVNPTQGVRQGEERFHYGTASVIGRYAIDEDDDIASVFLGDISVDENIDKLREVIGSVDNTLSRCLASSGSIGKAQRERQKLHLSIIGGLDSWVGMRGKFVSQRSLMQGVAKIEQSKEIYDESDLALIDDLSWQTSLAGSAVTAAEDVRAAVRASRTASNARATASAASLSAQTACEKGEFASMDEARAAQTRASIAQSHAIHSAVVEHEAKTVKRRATLALAHDVKTWNIHRKREMLRSCLSYAKSQHEASRRAVDAWSSLRDGFINSSSTPSTVDRRQVIVSPPPTQPTRSDPQPPRVDPDEVTATIFENTGDHGTQQPIVAVEHNILTSALKDFSVSKSESTEAQEPETYLPFAEVAPIPEEEGENESCSFRSNRSSCQSFTKEPLAEAALDSTGRSSSIEIASEESASVHAVDIRSTLSHTTFGSGTESESKAEAEQSNTIAVSEATFAEEGVVGNLIDLNRSFTKQEKALEASHSGETLSQSMKSLVDGLMTWGGGFDAEEKHFALPAGMATSIVLEESAGRNHVA